jgi:predicted small lipoprotein YifL
MWKRWASSVASVLAGASVMAMPPLAGCGQKGPLTLPAPAASSASSGAGSGAMSTATGAAGAASAPAR